jgi:O-antigen ligase
MDAAAAKPGSALPAAAAARFLLLLLIVAQVILRPRIDVFGLGAVPIDLLYLALFSAWLALLASGQARVPPHKAWWLLAAYLAVMLASALGSEAPWRSATKLLTQIYLLSLPLIVCTLVDDGSSLRRAVRWWLFGTAIVAGAAVVGLIAFAVDPHGPIVAPLRFHFGTLVPGDYPRFRLTFVNANMACNYLVVSLAILLAARRMGWIGKTPFRLLLAGILIAAATTISPGLGGLAIALAIWIWLLLRESRPTAAKLALAAGAGAGLLFLAAMAVTPVIHPTAPFLIPVPALDLTLAPAGRLMIWIDAVRNFLADPLLGRGIGVDAVDVRYLAPAGNLQRLTDAHNMFLNIAVQCGIPGLAAILALVVYAFRHTAPFRFLPGGANTMRLGLGLAFLNGFAYQGLGGSFEDSRHLWLLFGLFLASGRIEAMAADRGEAAPELSGSRDG